MRCGSLPSKGRCVKTALSECLATRCGMRSPTSGGGDPVIGSSPTFSFRFRTVSVSLEKRSERGSARLESLPCLRRYQAVPRRRRLLGRAKVDLKEGRELREDQDLVPAQIFVSYRECVGAPVVAERK